MNTEKKKAGKTAKTHTAKKPNVSQDYLMTWEEVRRTDTGAEERVERWRKQAEKHLGRVGEDLCDEIKVMAELRGLSVVDYVLAYLRATRIDSPDTKFGVPGRRFNRQLDASYDAGSRQARTAHEKEVVSFAVFHLGVRFGEGFTRDDMRVLAANFAMAEDWNLKPAKERAVRYAIEAKRLV